MRKFSPVIWFAARIFLGLVFTYSGYTKLLEPVENFRGVLTSYTIIPYIFVPWIAQSFPWFEFIFGVFILLGFATRWSALAAVGLSASFLTLLILTRIMTGAFPDDCGCFGEGSFIHLTGQQVIFLDLVDIVIGMRLFFLKEYVWGLDAWLGKGAVSKSSS